MCSNAHQDIMLSGYEYFLPTVVLIISSCRQAIFIPMPRVSATHLQTKAEAPMLHLSCGGSNRRNPTCILEVRYF